MPYLIAEVNNLIYGRTILRIMGLLFGGLLLHLHVLPYRIGRLFYMCLIWLGHASDIQTYSIGDQNSSPIR